ncbi:hypothetical protein TR13x_03380 [Caloranaerobacter sp. TR13]|uniref:nuclease-related domain-containing protein n=1 Tax=Caloranaerobacter sp. TR13 TaxID=1302151 RepID=UPI0006D47CA8|nr:NERD domain-containing protein [Caloranaerobacter sp. TR13]KPU27591.1 hypothetical protein TR13x_03380 [Caloranaerobacter sp. TR13]
MIWKIIELLILVVFVVINYLRLLPLLFYALMFAIFISFLDPEEGKGIFILIVELSVIKLIIDLVIKKILAALTRKRKKMKTVNLIKRELTRLNEEFSNILSHKVLKDDFSEVNEVMIKIDQQVDFMEKEKEVMDMLFSTPNNIKTAIDINKLDEISNSVENLRDVPEIERLYELIEKIKEKANKFTDFAKEAYEYINKMYFASRSGLAGEKRLNEELFLYRDVIKNLGSIRLEVENTTVESDSIIISENGVFCIEVKNYGDNSNSGKIVISKDGAWKRYNASGKEVPIHNVTAQIYRHIGIQQRFLNEELKKINAEDVPYVHFRPIVVIANDNIEIENNSDIPVLRISNVYHYILNYKAEEKLDKKYWDAIEKILVENNKGLKPYPVKHYTPQIVEAYEGLLSIANDFEKIYYSVLEVLH